MRDFDFSPLFRSGIGFDRLAHLVGQMAGEAETGYPPYNIEKLGENSYRISMAVAGFAPDELDVEVHENQVTIAGRKAPAQEAEAERVFLYRGIAQRSFERRFSLADHIRVTGAQLENGQLHVDLEREVPEALKPRRINIAVQGGQKAIESRKSA